MTLTNERINLLQIMINEKYGYYSYIDGIDIADVRFAIQVQRIAETIFERPEPLTLEEINVLRKLPPIVPSLWAVRSLSNPLANAPLAYATHPQSYASVLQTARDVARSVFGSSRAAAPQFTSGNEAYEYGNRAFDRHEFASALIYFTKAHQLFHAEGRLESATNALLSQGQTCIKLAQEKETYQTKINFLAGAVRAFDQAGSDEKIQKLQIYARLLLANISMDSYALQNIGADLVRLRKFGEAGTCYEKAALLIFDEAIITSNNANFTLALEPFSRAYQNYKAAHNNSGMLNVEEKWAEALSLLGEHEYAKTHYLAAATTAKENQEIRRAAKLQALAGREAVLNLESGHQVKIDGIKKILALEDIPNQIEILDKLAATLNDRGRRADEILVLTALELQQRKVTPSFTEGLLAIGARLHQPNFSQRLAAARLAVINEFLKALDTRQEARDALITAQEAAAVVARSKNPNIPQDYKYKLVLETIKALSNNGTNITPELLENIILCHSGATTEDPKADVSKLDFYKTTRTQPHEDAQKQPPKNRAPTRRTTESRKR